MNLLIDSVSIAVLCASRGDAGIITERSCHQSRTADGNLNLHLTAGRHVRSNSRRGKAFFNHLPVGPRGSSPSCRNRSPLHQEVLGQYRESYPEDMRADIANGEMPTK